MWVKGLFVVVCGSTVCCGAVNFYTWVVGYPLWRYVGAEDFGSLHKEYLRRLWPVITLPHVVMFFASAALIRWRPGFVGGASAAAVFGLDAGVVAVSALVAGPVHSRFERTGVWDAAGMRRLMAVSALRSGMMVVACGLVGWWISAGVRI